MSLAPEISIIIPVYNDESHIGKSLETLINFLNSENINAEIIIVNDGGKDASAGIIQEKTGKYNNILFINRKLNNGKGFSVREGVTAAHGEIIIFTDADLPYGVTYFKEMINLLKSGGADLVIANRNLAPGSQTQQNLSVLRKLTHRSFSFFVRKLLRLEFTDTQAGLKGLTKKVAGLLLPELKIDRFAFDLELLVRAKKAGLQIKEIPVVLENIGKSNISVLRDSFQMFKDILKIYFSI